MSRARDRRRRWQKREANGMNNRTARAFRNLGRAANRAARHLADLAVAFRFEYVTEPATEEQP